MIDWLINNWVILVVLVCIVIFVIWFVYNFITAPAGSQLAKVKEWLLLAVVEAEKQLGGGTGALKLRYVYDWFISKFPFTAKILSFSTFSKLVDAALDKMKHLLQTNQKVEAYVEGTQDGVEGE
jgi:hypothetical protein